MRSHFRIGEGGNNWLWSHMYLVHMTDPWLESRVRNSHPCALLPQIWNCFFPIFLKWWRLPECSWVFYRPLYTTYPVRIFKNTLPVVEHTIMKRQGRLNAETDGIWTYEKKNCQLDNALVIAAASAAAAITTKETTASLVILTAVVSGIQCQIQM